MVNRAHVIAWRKTFETAGKDGKPLAALTARREHSALSSLFEHLCNHNAVTHNPVKGVKRPTEGANEGKTAALGDDQARTLLDAPPADTLKGRCDRAIVVGFARALALNPRISVGRFSSRSRPIAQDQGRSAQRERPTSE